jgi:hypothetical protein
MKNQDNKEYELYSKPVYDTRIVYYTDGSSHVETYFKGYVDFFYLQDCVTEDYKQVHFWLGDGTFTTPPLPQTVDEYLGWIAAELDFLDKRNARIKASIS